MDNIQLQCTKQGHMQSPIQLICINEKCQNQNKLICLNCLGHHQQHIKELIQMGHLNSEITQLRKSIKQQIDSMYSEKQSLWKLIQEVIENKFQECKKQLLDFDNILKDFQNQKQAQGSEIYYHLASQLGNYCEIDSKKYQITQSSLLLKQNVLKNTVHKCSRYFSHLEQQLLNPFNKNDVSASANLNTNTDGPLPQFQVNPPYSQSPIYQQNIQVKPHQQNYQQNTIITYTSKNENIKQICYNDQKQPDKQERYYSYQLPSRIEPFVPQVKQKDIKK